MVVRTTMSHTHIKARSGSSRASVREVDDNHLMQQVKKADVFHSETPSDFERWQMVGLTSVPLKQEEDKKQQQTQQKKSSTKDDEGDWNHDQPQGKSSEAVMLYLNGDRNHPIAMIDDRRVRPMGMKEGETGLYAASGTGQIVYHNNNGSYVVALNNPPEQSKDNKETERYASLRHVNKKKQNREADADGKLKEDPSKYKHEGDSVNLEVRCTSNRIEFRAGEKVVGYYDKKEDTWYFTGKLIHNDATSEMRDTAKNINRTASENITDTASGQIHHNQA